MPQRCGIWFAVAGDLRFLSHHDTMRAMERTVARAGLEVRYSQGFNPRPILSLVCPRPVGVASRDDLVVVAVDAPASPRTMLADLNRHAPAGMTFHRMGIVANKATPRPRRAEYRLNVPTAKAESVANRLGELADRDTWPVQRLVSRRGRHQRGMTVRTIDLKPLVADAEIRDGQFRWALEPLGEKWARPGEVLQLVGLDERLDLAHTVRTVIQYQPPPQPLDGAPPSGDEYNPKQYLPTKRHRNEIQP